MTKRNIVVALAGVAALTVSAAGVASAQQQGDMDHSSMSGGMMNMPKTIYSDAEMKMSHAMMMAKGSDASHTWAKKMAEHHQGAIDMSRIVLQNSKDPEIRRLAQKTIDEQRMGIAELRAWLAKNP